MISPSAASPTRARYLRGRRPRGPWGIRSGLPTACISKGAYIENSDGVGDPVTFEDAYCGMWDSFADFIVEQTQNSGLSDGASETLERYFDWSKWIADCRYGYSVVDARREAGAAAVYVFRCL